MAGRSVVDYFTDIVEGYRRVVLKYRRRSREARTQ
jgi:hypothetical protein